MTLSRSDPKTISDAWERTIKPALENTNLITAEKSAEISKRLQVLQMTLEPSAIAQTARFIIKNALTTAAGTIGGRMSKKQKGLNPELESAIETLLKAGNER
jgi:hypothetical protein